MGFEYGNHPVLSVEIEGNDYKGLIDSPEIVEFWISHGERLNYLSTIQERELDDSEMADEMREFVALVVDFTTALLGAEATIKVFDGRERSLLFCASLMEYLNNEIEAQGLLDKLNEAANRYSASKVIG